MAQTYWLIAAGLIFAGVAACVAYSEHEPAGHARSGLVWMIWFNIFLGIEALIVGVCSAVALVAS
jgi:hypothetical protein